VIDERNFNPSPERRRRPITQTRHDDRWGPVPFSQFQNIFESDLHCVSKNVPPAACYNFDTHEWILKFLAEIVTNKIGNQKTLYYATLSNLCFCTTWQNGETRKSHFRSAGLCYWYNTPVRCLSERKICHLWCVWYRLTFVDTVGYLISTAIDFHSKLEEEHLPTFTQRLTPWQTWLIQSMWVTDSRMLCSLPRSCMVHTVDRFDSEGWFSSDQVIF